MMDKSFSLKLEVAERLAQELVGLLEDSCVRIQVAGSVRRKKPRPSDIEIVVEPIIGEIRQVDLLGNPGEPIKSSHRINLFDERCKELIRRGMLEKRQKSNGQTAWGEKAKLGIIYLGGEWAPVDIFSVIEPATWGVILALKTGPGDFSKVLVNHAHTIGRKVVGGRVWAMGHLSSEDQRMLSHMPSTQCLRCKPYDVVELEADAEVAYFEALGIPCWPPEKRTAQRLRQYLGRQRNYAA
jgi:hypothetical protein